MTKAVTGEEFNTSFGRMIVAVEFEAPVAKGDRVLFNEKEYTVVDIVAPTVPTGRWAFKVVE